MNTLRKTAATLLALVVATAGLGSVVRVAAEDANGPSDAAPREALRPAPGGASRKEPIIPKALDNDLWPLSLQEAVRIGLNNSEVVRVIPSGAAGANGGSLSTSGNRNKAAGAEIAPGDSMVIAPIRVDLAPWRLKADVMAHVRSIEQQYWALAQQLVRLWAAETAVDLGEQTLRRERAKLDVDASSQPNVAEAQDNLEQFRLELVSATADVITSERQLRSILGLPPADNRRIVPATAPTETRLEPDWDASRAAMLEKQPDISRVKAGPKLSKDQDRLEQVVQQTTHSLARFFLEIESNYKQLQTAKRFLKEAEARLQAQQANYEKGQVSIDRLYDAIRRWATAHVQEAQAKTSYNASIASFEEAKGTLLEHDHIAVVERPLFDASTPDRRDGEATAAPYPAPTRTEPGDRPAALAPAVAQQEGLGMPKDSTAAKTITFRFTIGSGARPVELRGSFTVGTAECGDGKNTP